MRISHSKMLIDKMKSDSPIGELPMMMKRAIDGRTAVAALFAQHVL